VEPVAHTLSQPAEPVQAGNRIGDHTLIYYNGSAEHIGDTTFYEELQGDDDAFPTFRNVNLNTEPHASRPYPTHRTNQTTSKVLSVTQLSTEELLNAVKPHGRALIETYFKIVFPIFPGPAKEQIVAFLDDPAADKDGFTSLAPFLACLMILGSQSASIAIFGGEANAAQQLFLGRSCLSREEMPRYGVATRLCAESVRPFTVLVVHSRWRPASTWICGCRNS
jgi:hypothetical protein